MFKPRDTATDAQSQFWVETKRLPKATASTFYRKLDETLGRNYGRLITADKNYQKTTYLLSEALITHCPWQRGG